MRVDIIIRVDNLSFDRYTCFEIVTVLTKISQKFKQFWRAIVNGG